MTAERRASDTYPNSGNRRLDAGMCEHCRDRPRAKVTFGRHEHLIRFCSEACAMAHPAVPDDLDALRRRAAAMTEVCDCGHPRDKHALPGALGTPCSEPGCWCDSFGVLR